MRQTFFIALCGCLLLAYANAQVVTPPAVCQVEPALITPYMGKFGDLEILVEYGVGIKGVYFRTGDNGKIFKDKYDLGSFSPTDTAAITPKPAAPFVWTKQSYSVWTGLDKLAAGGSPNIPGYQCTGTPRKSIVTYQCGTPGFDPLTLHTIDIVGFAETAPCTFAITIVTPAACSCTPPPPMPPPPPPTPPTPPPPLPPPPSPPVPPPPSPPPSPPPLPPLPPSPPPPRPPSPPLPPVFIDSGSTFINAGGNPKPSPKPEDLPKSSPSPTEKSVSPSPNGKDVSPTPEAKANDKDNSSSPPPVEIIAAAPSVSLPATPACQLKGTYQLVAQGRALCTDAKEYLAYFSGKSKLCTDREVVLRAENKAKDKRTFWKIDVNNKSNTSTILTAGRHCFAGENGLAGKPQASNTAVIVAGTSHRWTFVPVDNDCQVVYIIDSTRAKNGAPAYLTSPKTCTDFVPYLAPTDGSAHQAWKVYKI